MLGGKKKNRVFGFRRGICVQFIIINIDNDAYEEAHDDEDNKHDHENKDNKG